MTRQDDRQDNRQDAAPAGLTVAEVATRLGVTPDAVRRRLHRGTLAGAKTADGEWRVWLPEPEGGDWSPGSETGDRQDATRTAPGEPPADLIAVYEGRLAEMREDLVFLRNELTARTEELRRKDHIIAGFIERLPELPTGEDAPRTRLEPPGAAGPGHPARGTLAARWRRWWRRVVDGP